MTQIAPPHPDRTLLEMPQAAAPIAPKHDGCPGTCSSFCQKQDKVACVEIAQNRAVRWWLMAMGIVSVGLGAVGAVVPGLPTTVFLIIASWCFVRSCPALERVLIRNRFFAPFVRYLQPGAVMPTKARVFTTAAIWIATLTSSLVLMSRDVPFVLAVVLASAAVGTVAVWLVARGKKERAAEASPAEACEVPTPGFDEPQPGSAPSRTMIASAS